MYEDWALLHGRLGVQAALTVPLFAARGELGALLVRSMRQLSLCPPCMALWESRPSSPYARVH